MSTTAVSSEQSTNDNPDLVKLTKIDSQFVDDFLTSYRKAIEEKNSPSEEKSALAETETYVGGLRALLMEMGEKIDEDQLRMAIGHTLAKQYALAPPLSQKGMTKAKLWVNRKRIGYPALGIIAASGITYGAIVGIQAIQERRNELKVEHDVAQLCLNHSLLEQRINAVEKDPLASTFPSISFKQSLGKAKTSSQSVTPYLQYCTSPREMVTSENYSSVQKTIVQPEKSLQAGISAINEAETELRTERTLVKGKSHLDTALAAFQGAPDVYAQKAHSYYQQGLQSLEKRDVQQLNISLTSLRSLQGDLQSFKTLSDKVHSLYKSISAVSKDPVATGEATVLYREAQTAINLANTKEMETLAKKMETLDTVLKEEYTLVVFGGDIRTPESGGMSDYYLLVAAHEGSESGPILKRTIFSEETKKSRAVCGWGEKVSRYDFEEVKRDKQDNGLIDRHNIFGRKHRGYKSVEYSLRPLGGRITEWEVGQQPAGSCK